MSRDPYSPPLCRGLKRFEFARSSFFFCWPYCGWAPQGFFFFWGLFFEGFFYGWPFPPDAEVLRGEVHFLCVSRGGSPTASFLLVRRGAPLQVAGLFRIRQFSLLGPPFSRRQGWSSLFVAAEFFEAAKWSVPSREVEFFLS